MQITSFKLPKTLRAKARRAAKDTKVSFGEFVRQAVTEKIERDAKTATA